MAAGLSAQIADPRLSAAEKLALCLPRQFDIVSLALRARQAWERAEPYKKQLGFAPSDVGISKNTEIFLGLVGGVFHEFKNTETPAEREEERENIENDFSSWKKKFVRFLVGDLNPTERGLQVQLTRLFWNVFPDPQHVLNFVKTGGYADFKLGNISKGRYSVIEVKKSPVTGKVPQGYLRDALCQAALYVIIDCIGHAVENHSGRTYERKVAAVSLPTMMSRLGQIKLVIDEHGMLNPDECRFEIGKLVVWTGYMAKEEAMQERIEKERVAVFEKFRHFGKEVAKQVADYHEEAR